MHEHRDPPPLQSKADSRVHRPWVWLGLPQAPLPTPVTPHIPIITHRVTWEAFNQPVLDWITVGSFHSLITRHGDRSVICALMTFTPHGRKLLAILLVNILSMRR
jgi:hypothetical protein